MMRAAPYWGSFILFFSLASIVGCGGGTTGTDSSTVNLRGSLVSSRGEPLAGLQVVVEESGDSAVSDARGLFTIITTLELPELTLLVHSDRGESRVTLGSVPDTSAGEFLSVKLEVNEEPFVVSIVSLSVRPIDAPADTSTTTPAASPPPPPPHRTPSPSTSGETIIKGQVLMDGEPLAGAEVRVMPGRGSGMSDVLGRFHIRTKSRAGVRTLTVSYGGFSDSVSTPALPSGDLEVELTLLIVSGSNALDPQGDVQPTLVIREISIQR